MAEFSDLQDAVIFFFCLITFRRRLAVISDVQWHTAGFNNSSSINKATACDLGGA